MRSTFLYLAKLCFLFSLLSPHYCLAENNENGLRKVTLQLKWKHQFQFAGYYAAIEKGYFSEAGIQVELVEASETHSPNQAVFNGQADFGISSSTVLSLRSEHKDLVVLASIFQHSPMVLLVLGKSGIRHAHDLIGKKIALEQNSGEILAYLHNEGVSLDKCVIKPQNYDLTQLINGEVDAISAYTTDETFLLEEAGITYRVLSPMMVGLDFYGDVLFTTEELIRKEPELVRKFREAALKGWKYALNNQDEIIDLIYDKYTHRHSKVYLHHEAEHMKSLVIQDLVEIGYSNPDRWQHILEIYQNANLIDKSQTNKGLVYAVDSGQEIPWRIIVPFSLVILVVGSISYFFYYTSRKLRIEIHNRQKFQNELQKSEELYRSVLTASPDTIIISDMEGQIRFVSPMVVKMFGYQEKDVLNHPLFNYLSENDRESARESISQMISGNFTGAKEYNGLRVDGSVFPIEVIGGLISGAAGVPTGIVFVVRNITERKTAESRLKESEETFRRLVESINDVIFEVTNDGVINYISPSIERALGYSPDELIGESFLNFVYKEDRAFVANKLSELLDRNYSFLEYRYLSKSGEIRWARSSTGALFDNGKIVGGTGSMTDITEYKKAEGKILKANRIYEFISQINQSIVLIRDKDQLLKEVCRIAVFTGNFRMAWIGFINEETKEVTPYIFAGEESGYLSLTKMITANDLPEGRGPAGTAIREGKHYVCEDIENDPKMVLWREEALIRGYRSVIAIPIKQFGKAKGAFILYSHLTHFFDSEEVELLDEVTDNISFALDALETDKEVKDLYANLELKIKERTKQLAESNETLLKEIEERTRVEKALSVSEQNYETFFNTIDDFLWVMDEQGNILHVNTTVRNRLNYTEEELKNQSILMMYVPERREEAGRIIGKMLSGKSDMCVVPIMSKSGQQIPVETRVKPGFWNNQQVIFGISKDITQIELSEQKFSTAFQANSAMMSIANFDSGKFIDINNEFVEILGYSREEIIGRTGKELRIFVDQKTRAEITKSINDSIPVRKKVVQIRTKDGTIKSGLISSDLIEIGNERCLLSVMIDITERIKAEEDTRKARLEAEQANLAKSEFLSRMSHELRTPMNSILGFAQLLDMGELNSGQKKGVKHILRSGKHLLDLINEVLDISRIEAGHLSLSLEPVQVKRVIKEMMDLVRQQAFDRQIKLELVESENERLTIKSDLQRLKQILLNLLNNAIKYNKRGGSVVVDTTMMVKNSSGETPVRISINDSGLGIAAEDIPKLFNPFERIGAEKTETEGTGLGLSVVKKLVDAMGGNIGVESEPGKGSTFWIEFPLCEDKLENNEKFDVLEELELRLMGKSGLILYIEDNSSNVELIEEILISQRSNIRLVTNTYGSNAVPLAIELKPSLILLDLNLPDMHGSEVLGLLKADVNTQAIPVVVVSADAMPQQIERLIEAGAKRYITKPLDLSALLKIIDEFVVG